MKTPDPIRLFRELAGMPGADRLQAIVEDPSILDYLPLALIAARTEGYAQGRADMAEEADRFARWIVERTECPGDWACAECKPHSEILMAGFQCVWHRAKSYRSERAAAGGQR